MKIVQVLNAMIANPEKISNVIKSDKEFFFLYDGKHKWSVLKWDREDEYSVFIYPKFEGTLEDLPHVDFGTFNDYVSYTTKELKTTEARETFAELYQIVSSKVFGVDDIFNEILTGN
jgi:hypothetical protein